MADKFSDIQVGDKVYVVKVAGVRTPRSTIFPKKFEAELTVTKITKTQFTAHGVRFKKDTGYEIGGNLVAKKVGCPLSNYTYDKTKELIKGVDQTAEMNSHIEKCNKIKQAHGLLNDVNIYRIKDVDDALTVALKVIHLSEGIEKLINEGSK